MKLSYSAIWDDSVALVRAHGSLAAALAGVFLFLPALLVQQFAGPLEPLAGTPQDLLHLSAAVQVYFYAHWPVIVAARLAETIGSIAILKLALGPRGTSVGGAIVAGLVLLPSYFAAFVLANMAMVFGFLLLIVPGIYLMGRLIPFAPVIVAEERRNPIAALTRALALTRGHGWSIAGLILLVLIAAAIVSGVAASLFGILFVLALGKGLGTFLTTTLAAAIAAAVGIVTLFLYAAIYRALTHHGSADVFA